MEQKGHHSTLTLKDDLFIFFPVTGKKIIFRLKLHSEIKVFVHLFVCPFFLNSKGLFMDQGASPDNLDYRVLGQGMRSAWWRCERKPVLSWRRSRASGKEKGVCVSSASSMMDT